MIDWVANKPTKADADFIKWIVQRIEDDEGEYSRRLRGDYITDLEVAHHDIPLDLPKLYQFEDLSFWHDINGIERHLDRETGVLGGCFLPRCAMSV